MRITIATPFTPDEHISIPSDMSMYMSNKGLVVNRHITLYKKVVLSYSNEGMRIFFYSMEDYLDFNTKFDIRPGEFEGA